MLELAHYEWIELVMSVSNKEWPEDIDPQGDLLGGVPALNPVLSLLQYSYPVHQIGPHFRPKTPLSEPTHLLVFRNRDFEVRFVHLNPVSARLLDLLGEGAHTGQQALESIANELKHPNPAAVITGGLEILKNLLEQEAILGTLSSN